MRRMKPSSELTLVVAKNESTSTDHFQGAASEAVRAYKADSFFVEIFLALCLSKYTFSNQHFLSFTFEYFDV